MFCSNCGKKIRQDARFCMYCGKAVNNTENDCNNKENNETFSDDIVFAENDTYDKYSNYENGNISFQKMFKKFFSKEIKEYFSFDGTYSRLEYFYSNVIIYIALGAIVVPFIAAPKLYVIIAVPLTVAFFWLLAASYVKRLKDIGVSLWIILIPPICVLFIKGNESGSDIAWLILIIYHLFVFFEDGKKFQNEDEIEEISEETFEDLKEDIKSDISYALRNAVKIGCFSIIIMIFIAAILYYFQ